MNVSLSFASPARKQNTTTTTNRGNPMTNGVPAKPLQATKTYRSVEKATWIKIHKRIYHPSATTTDHNTTGSAHCGISSMTPSTQHRHHTRKVTPSLARTQNHSQKGSPSHHLGQTHPPTRILQHNTTGQTHCGISSPVSSIRNQFRTRKRIPFLASTPNYSPRGPLIPR